MNENRPKAATIDEYIRAFPPDIQAILQSLRETIHETAPQAVEAISYGMPTFKLNGNLVHFAAHKHHIGFYPTPSGINPFMEELSSYETSKGAIRFPIDQPLPLDLVRRIVAFRIEEVIRKK